eukprot:366928-Rhodomonas_salina.1
MRHTTVVCLRYRTPKPAGRQIARCEYCGRYEGTRRRREGSTSIRPSLSAAAKIPLFSTPIPPFQYRHTLPFNTAILLFQYRYSPLLSTIKLPSDVPRTWCCSAEICTSVSRIRLSPRRAYTEADLEDEVGAFAAAENAPEQRSPDLIAPYPSSVPDSAYWARDRVVSKRPVPKGREAAVGGKRGGPASASGCWRPAAAASTSSPVVPHTAPETRHMSEPRTPHGPHPARAPHGPHPARTPHGPRGGDGPGRGRRGERRRRRSSAACLSTAQSPATHPNSHSNAHNTHTHDQCVGGKASSVRQVPWVSAVGTEDKWGGTSVKSTSSLMASL